jgi:hypothetical protein
LEQTAGGSVETAVKKLIAGLGFVAGGILVLVVTSWAFAPAERIDTGASRIGVDPRRVYNPVTAGEALPDGFRQLLPRDGIRPIYEPSFTTASGVDWPAETQVIGVSSGEEAKAYPVSVLNRHEMVNDFIAGDPILVTW